MKTVDQIIDEMMDTESDGNSEVLMVQRSYVARAMEEFASQVAQLRSEQKWISVKERPLFTKNEKGHWEATEDGEGEFLAAVPYYENGKGDKWWIRHCVIEDVTGLCVVGDDYNEPAGWHLEDVTHFQILPEPPKI